MVATGKADTHIGRSGPELGNPLEKGILCWHVFEPVEGRILTRHSLIEVLDRQQNRGFRVSVLVEA